MHEEHKTDLLAKVAGSGTIELVRIEDLQTDPVYQRDLSRDLVERIKANWDMSAAGYIVVSRRASGALYIVNGQHRTAAAVDLGLTEIAAQVIDGLDARQEAELRLMGNTARTDSSQERFRAQVAAGHPESLKIMEICAQFGTRINPSNDMKHGINSVSAVEDLYRRDDGMTLIKTLEVIKDAFGEVGGKAAGVAMLKGIAFTLTTHPSEIDRQRLIDRIQAETLDDLERQARNFKAAVGGPLWMNTYRAILAAYNTRLPESSRIEPRTGGWTKALGHESGGGDGRA